MRKNADEVREKLQGPDQNVDEGYEILGIVNSSMALTPLMSVNGKIHMYYRFMV